MNAYILQPSNDCSKSIEEVRLAFSKSGVSVAEWARANGFSSGLVNQILLGQRKCIRGQSYEIAVALGLKEGEPLDVATLSKQLRGKDQQPNPIKETEM